MKREYNTRPRDKNFHLPEEPSHTTWDELNCLNQVTANLSQIVPAENSNLHVINTIFELYRKYGFQEAAEIDPMTRTQLRNAIIGLSQDVVQQHKNPRREIEKIKSSEKASFLQSVRSQVKDITLELSRIKTAETYLNTFSPDIAERLRQLKDVNLYQHLIDENAISTFLRRPLSKLNEVAIFRRMFDYSWKGYSQVFILKQYLNHYEMRRCDLEESQRHQLANLQQQLEPTYPMMRRFFRALGIEPIEINLFEVYNGGEYTEAPVVKLRNDSTFRRFVSVKVDGGELSNGTMIEIHALGYRSNLPNVPDRLPIVAIYHQADTHQFFKDP